MKNILTRIIGNESSQYIKKISPILKEINKLEDKYSKYSDEELKKMTIFFREKLSNGDSLDSLVPDTYAIVREVSKRVLGLRPFDSQVLGAIILNNHMITEMKTGEGKTLVSSMPGYLNALTGKSVHIITVNDYLAKRDAEKIGKIYKFLDMTVGVIYNGMSKSERKHAYSCDIVYGTNNEFAFDYLKDNMVYNSNDVVQKGLHYAIIDEIDSVLIDEARTPLIISNQGKDSIGMYPTILELVKKLKAEIKETEEQGKSKVLETIREKVGKGVVLDNEDYDIEVSEKNKTAVLTLRGVKKLEEYLKIDNLYDEKLNGLLHMITQVIISIHVMKRDVDYIVENDTVLIVDEFTGRVMNGRRFSNGLHQAIEVKEGVEIQPDNNTVASITFQHFFKMYDKLAGMTGTAETEKEEFGYIYGLKVIVVPTNKPIIRKDAADNIFKTLKGKEKAIIDDIVTCYEKGQPVLVGTCTVDYSEKISKKLKKIGIEHKVLNAKNHKQEAEIISQAGKYKSVTIATNMAGRGTDILLGGNAETMANINFYEKYGEQISEIEDKISFISRESNRQDDYNEKMNKYNEMISYYAAILSKYKIETEEEKEQVVSVGGLRVLGTERHENRRIDNQLRGRSGRQGDVGSSQFYLSFEDDLIRLFGGSSAKGLIDKMSFDENSPINSPVVSKIIEKAQKRIEEDHYFARKMILEYDTVLNTHRNIIYDERGIILKSEDISNHIREMVASFLSEIVSLSIDKNSFPEDWNYADLINEIKKLFSNININSEDIVLSKEEMNSTNPYSLLLDKVQSLSEKAYNSKIEELGIDVLKKVEKDILLKVITSEWQYHLEGMEHLKKGSRFVSLGKTTDARYVYQQEAFDLFEYTKRKISERTIEILFKVVLKK